ncbi:nucleotidyl transferase AbiEii/AbiGii toxin family protein [Pedobacter jamesrossensis]|uniref:Nucleotidyl transferase AbiEii/AbiGii toxin family protein n=1 Tax=Pedobacter jamesrossensis TaxID=1908238 RepID=A0ABV8NMU5_9SPHI
MAKIYLHEHKDFLNLINIIADEKAIEPYLVEKDYWIMHSLYGLKEQGFDFELKGGTSLSKGFGYISRFSEDIDIVINPPVEVPVKVFAGKNHNKEAHIKSRIDYYQWLTDNIKISGIIQTERDQDFDSTPKYFGGGIRLFYKSFTNKVEGAKEGVLLEVGFDDISPNQPITISSWVYDRAIPSKVEIIDNRAVDIKCYNPEYTFVEKLQAIIRKFAQEQSSGEVNQNFLRQYYDVYELLGHKEVVDFVGTSGYIAHKERRFNTKELETPLAKNAAFDFSDESLLKIFNERFLKTKALYYKGQPTFEEIIERIKLFLDKM